MHIEKNLRFLRESFNYTQQEVANKIGISKSYYNKFENGSRLPNLKILTQLSKFYKVPFHFFMIKNYLQIENRYFTLSEISSLLETYLQIISFNSFDKKDKKSKMIIKKYNYLLRETRNLVSRHSDRYKEF